MGQDEREDTRIYKVVVNHEEQYSIWPADRENPLGWNDTGKHGTKEECLAYIKQVWTDMRPLSLRKKMEESRAGGASATKDAVDRGEHDDKTLYKVVVNHEGQYSIWPADRENALGWHDAGKQGTKEECFAYIDEVWTDRRPRSLKEERIEHASEEETGGQRGDL